MAVCVSTYDQQRGRDERYALPFVFFDIPATIDGKIVATSYERARGGGPLDMPSGCLELRYRTVQQLHPGETAFVTDPISIAPKADIVWQTFKSGFLVTDAPHEHNAYVVKVVKLS